MSAEPASNSVMLSEFAVAEVLAYLVTAARTQLDEAAEYAPMRLLTAATRLGDALGPTAPAPLRVLVDQIRSMPLTATPTADREAYEARLDELCVAVADCLIELDGEDPR